MGNKSKCCKGRLCLGVFFLFFFTCLIHPMMSESYIKKMLLEGVIKVLNGKSDVVYSKPREGVEWFEIMFDYNDFKESFVYKIKMQQINGRFSFLKLYVADQNDRETPIPYDKYVDKPIGFIFKGLGKTEYGDLVEKIVKRIKELYCKMKFKESLKKNREKGRFTNVTIKTVV